MTATLVLGAMPGWAIGVLVAGFLLMCVLLVLTVLIQRPQGGGLAGAFGGAAGSGQTAGFSCVPAISSRTTQPAGSR